MTKKIAILTTALALHVATSRAQEWLWIQDERVLNPSGINIQTNSTQFQVLDWNGDGLWDFMINETGVLQYYEGVGGDPPSWTKKEVPLPEIGINRGYGFSPHQPKNFEFFDWDQDGDYDLAADSSKFWWNHGSNASPIWVPDDSLLAGIEFGHDFFFVDYDGDGDWDATADAGPYAAPAFYLNQGDNMTPQWVTLEKFFHYEANAATFVHWNPDGMPDLAMLFPLICDPCFGFELQGFVNRGTLFKPDWQNVMQIPLPRLTLTTRENIPAYDLLDYNGDSLVDVVKTNWQRQIEFLFNRGESGSVSFGETDLIVGALGVESDAYPVFFDANGDHRPDLLVAENHLSSFQFNFFQSGALRGFLNIGHGFDPTFELTENIPRPFYWEFLGTKNSFVVTFADVDQDDDEDFLIGFRQVNVNDELVGSALLFFNNVGSRSAPDWQPDSTRFSRFLDIDSLFYAPQLIDIDHDGDLDLFVQRGGVYTFYERLNTPEENWQENRAWLEGLETLEHYSAVFVDLTLDGWQDLVFGETDGTLRFYENTRFNENVHRRSQPRWKLVPEAFAGIDVGSDAAPAFADLDGDGRMDLVVGNADGRLFFFRNASTVDVAAQPSSAPTTFRLHQNYPNPFNPETTMEYELAEPGNVRLTIYNLLGQRIRTLVDEWQPAGKYRVHWDGHAEGGAQSVASGVYVVELRLGEKSMRRKMILLR